jgi:hypothetical protein
LWGLFAVPFYWGVYCCKGRTQCWGKKSVKKENQLKAFKVYKKKCLGCHNSVADPEKPGRTRDDWHMIVNIMHDYGMDLSEAQSELIIDLLYDLRRGIEREAG